MALHLLPVGLRENCGLSHSRGGSGANGILGANMLATSLRGSTLWLGAGSIILAVGLIGCGGSKSKKSADDDEFNLDDFEIERF